MSCFSCIGIPVPLYHPYLELVTPPEVVNQFTGHISPGFLTVPEGHRCTGLEYVFSALAASNDPRRKVCSFPASQRIYPLRLVLSVHRCGIITLPTSPCVYFHDYRGISHEQVHQFLIFSCPCVPVISMITGDFSHERVHRDLTFHPTNCAPVDSPVFSQFDNLWSPLLALTPELGKAQSKDPREAVVHIAEARFLLGKLDTGPTHVLAYKKPGLIALCSPLPPLRVLHQTSLITQEGPGRAQRHNCR